MRALGLLVLCGVTVGCSCGGSTKKPVTVGDIIGQVEISEGLPASQCLVVADGVPTGARCGEAGGFQLKGVQQGRRDIIVLPSPDADPATARRVVAAANAGVTTNLGLIRLTRPGSIAGRVKGGTPDELARAIVALKGIGVATAVNANGGFLVEQAPPGETTVVLLIGDKSAEQSGVVVKPNELTVLPDFVASEAKAGMGAVVGQAARAYETDQGNGGIDVELVEVLDGKSVGTAKTSESGAFRIAGPPGIYFVRASETGNPRQAIARGVVLTTSDVALGGVLLIAGPDGDLDGDGLFDADDLDTDGDGVANGDDAFPYDPSEWRDTDGDGVGDNADLRSMGGTSVDNHVATPDGDGDGFFDFQDVCVALADPLQADGDHDGYGDLCDNCPTVANPTQVNVCGPMGGCRFNTDCAGGQLCSLSNTCVDCLTNQHCGDRVCRGGMCGNCTATADCANGLMCNTTLGACQQCLVAADCAGGRACVQGACLPTCTIDAQCPMGYCQSQACVQCRTHGDCGTTQYCDNGQCRPQCVTSGDCTGGYVCDLQTRACVAPCAAGCPQGQTCVGGTACRRLCDVSSPCPVGQKCNAQSACEPECAMNGDCTGAFQRCQAGQCVPDGRCATDQGCPVSQLCVAGSCVMRTTAAAPDGGGFACTTPCDCRMGEACRSGVCLVDKVPTIFVQLDGGPSDAGISTVTDLVGAVNGAPSGSVIALRAEDAWLMPGNAQLRVGARTQLAGGYVTCGANRWVPDLARRTRIATQYSTSTAVATTGTVGVPTPDVVIRGLEVSLYTCSGSSVTAAFSDRLTIENVAGNLMFVRGNCGPQSNNTNTVAVLDSRDISVNGVQLVPSGPGEGRYIAVVLARISGSISNVYVPITDQYQVVAVQANGTVGDLTIDRVVTEGGNAQGYGRSAGIEVAAAQTGRVTVKNSRLAIPSSTNGNMNTWSAIFLDGAADAIVEDNVVEGSTLAATSEAPYAAGLRLDNSKAIVRRNTVNLPLTTHPNKLYGLLVNGPRAELVVQRNTLNSGGLGAGRSALVEVNSVSIGPVVFDENTLRMPATACAIRGLAVVGTNGGVFATGNLIDLGATSLTSCGDSYATAAVDCYQSQLRLERNVAIARGGVYNTSALQVNSCAVEGYGNFMASGRAAAGSSRAIWANDGSSSLRFIGNTFESGGFLSSGTSSVFLDYGANYGQGIELRSNIISAGASPGKRFFGNVANTPAYIVRNNYFWYPRVEGLTGGDAIIPYIVETDGGVADPNRNIMAYSNSCLDPAYPAPSYVIASGSRCVNAGAAGTRLDGSAITLDIDGGPRQRGAAVDIGAFERE